MRRSILDTGPIVSLFDASDSFHKSVYTFLKNFDCSLYTTWPVITETSYLLDFNKATQLDFLKWITTGAVRIVDLSVRDLSFCMTEMKKYSDVPMDLADASLMLIADKLDIKSIITLDKDFYIYRTQDNKSLKNHISELIPKKSRSGK